MNIHRSDPNAFSIEAGPILIDGRREDGVFITFQNAITRWTPEECRRMAKTLLDCAAHVEAQSATRTNGIVVR